MFSETLRRVDSADSDASREEAFFSGRQRRGGGGGGGYLDRFNVYIAGYGRLCVMNGGSILGC